MINTILSGAGFTLGETYKECRFLKAPRETYAVYNDSYARRGADAKNLVKEHSVTIELYSYSPDPGAEKRIEDKLDALAIPYDKHERYWIQSEQLYQVIYEFDYIEK